MFEKLSLIINSDVFNVISSFFPFFSPFLVGILIWLSRFVKKIKTPTLPISFVMVIYGVWLFALLIADSPLERLDVFKITANTLVVILGFVAILIDKSGRNKIHNAKAKFWLFEINHLDK